MGGSIVGIFACLGLSTSSHPQDFNDYLADKQDVFCNSIECVKVETGYVSEEVVLDVERYSIRKFSTDSYLILSVGTIQFGDIEVRAVNIAGYWFGIN
jgi:hypothetical protein